MATQQQIESINTAAPDGGLAQVFEQKDVDKLLVEHFQTEDIKTLEDFASSFTTAKWETEAEDLEVSLECLLYLFSSFFGAGGWLPIEVNIGPSSFLFIRSSHI